MIVIDTRGSRRQLSDEHNPCIYVEEFQCHNCGAWETAERVTWVPVNGIPRPTCEECKPDA